MRYPAFIEADMDFPEFGHVIIHHPRPRVDDIPGTVSTALGRVMQGAVLKRGDRVAIGVGGSLDFVTGRATRAPRWLQRLGLEWLHRLFKEPWRWRRMLALPRFAVMVVFKRPRTADR